MLTVRNKTQTACPNNCNSSPPKRQSAGCYPSAQTRSCITRLRRQSLLRGALLAGEFFCAAVLLTSRASTYNCAPEIPRFKLLYINSPVRSIARGRFFRAFAAVSCFGNYISGMFFLTRDLMPSRAISWIIPESLSAGNDLSDLSHAL